jgi:catechol 2,3-dioxygenase-like lactoylglutathione lyase family enzyme
MNRFHVHVAVDDLETSVDFYSKLFGQQPSRHEVDYAKWMLDDPRVNFAISARGHKAGLNHLGIQTDTAEGLAALRRLADAAAPDDVRPDNGAACCYAKSDKHWTIDPQGIAWEHFHTMENAIEFGHDTKTQSGACCIPLRAGA